MFKKIKEIRQNRNSESKIVKIKCVFVDLLFILCKIYSGHLCPGVYMEVKRKLTSLLPACASLEPNTVQKVWHKYFYSLNHFPGSFL